MGVHPYQCHPSIQDFPVLQKIRSPRIPTSFAINDDNTPLIAS